MMIPHYHVWVRVWGGRGHSMLGVKATKKAIQRWRERKSRRVAIRHWRTQQAAHAALVKSGRKGFVRKCTDDDCPEALAVLEN